MKAKRLLSVVLAVAVVLSCAMALAFAPTASAASEYNTYAQLQESLLPENNYGLADSVNEGKILQAWNWSYENIIARMEQVAQQGFTTIQVSPPNELKMATKGIMVCEPAVDGIAPNGWWMFYQPAGFQLNESEDNALGVKSEFVAMCAAAKEYGLKIIVDAVINHMGTDDDHVGVYDNTSTDPMDHVNSRAAEFEPELLAAQAFHSPWIDMTYVENLGQSMRQYDSTGLPILNAKGDYTYGGSATEKDIEESLTQHCTSGLPDLATETQLVQDTIYAYLEELVLAGADGFRFDAAKHIETTHDSYYPSDFWEDTLLKLREEYPAVECYAYGEILNKCGDGRPFSEYTELMDVTDSSSYWGIKDAVVNNGNGGNSIPYYQSEADGCDPTTVNFTKENVIQWNESHDTYIDGSTSSLTVMQRNKIWALTAARQKITGVYFARPDDATGANRAAIEAICANIELGEANETSWANPEVAAVNQFDNFFGDASEYNTVQNKVTLIERGGLGATLVNLSGTTKTVEMKAYTLAAGTYIDAITGNEFEVSYDEATQVTTFTGTIGSTGIACIYYAEDTEPVFPELPLDPWEYPIEGETFPILDGYNTVVLSLANDTNWSNTYYYCWKEGTSECESSWPGKPMKFVRTNDYGQAQYVAYVPAEYDCYIINNGNGGGANQTIDLKIEGNTGMYLADTSGAEGKWTIGTWEPGWIDITPKAEDNTTPSTAPSTDPSTAPTDPVATTLLGDVDGSGAVNVKDATAIQKTIADIEVLGYNEAAADTDRDGNINIKDATAIQKWVADLLTDSLINTMI